MAVIQELIEAAAEQEGSDRKLAKLPGSISSTALLYCPMKADFREKYPEIRTLNHEISQGFAFEARIKQAAMKKYGPGRVVPEMMVPYKAADGTLVVSHPDLLIAGNRQILCLEMKRPKWLFHDLPFEVAAILTEQPMTVFNGPYVQRLNVMDTYITQARMQKLLLGRLVCDDAALRQALTAMALEESIDQKQVEPLFKNMRRKPVKHVLVIQGPAMVLGYGYATLTFERETEYGLTDAEMNELVDRYHTEKLPRKGWECPYCAYKKAQLCKGFNIMAPEPERADLDELEPEVREALDDYVQAYELAKQKESFLKKALNDKNLLVKVAGREKQIGKIEKPNYEWDYEKLIKILGSDVYDYLMINWRRKNELEQIVAETTPLSQVRKVNRVQEWKGLL